MIPRPPPPAIQPCPLSLTRPTVPHQLAQPQDEASIYIVQELCSGGDASGLLAAAGGRLDEREAAAVMLGALRFLARAHDAGVCYGDVKPSNFVLRQLYPSIAHMLDPAVPKGPIDLCAVDFGCCQHTEPGACLPSVVRAARARPWRDGVDTQCPVEGAPRLSHA